MMKKIGFLLNPYAGMGGRVGLKGTDGVVEEAIKRGATPVSPGRAKEAIMAFKKEIGRGGEEFLILTCSSPMGENVLESTLPGSYRVVLEVGEKTEAEDTRRAAKTFVEREVDLILFCGGDGTARDIFEAIDARVPMLGIPAGVKMHSGVFAVNPRAAGRLLAMFLKGEVETAPVEIVDLDEEEYRRGGWVIRTFGEVVGLRESTLIQSTKELQSLEGEREALGGIADYLEELMERDGDVLYILGPGSTLKRVAERIGVEKTLLGVDALYGGRAVGRDLSESDILRLLERYPRAKVVLSPIGGQGFFLGRGNQQISPEVIRRVGVENIVVVSTPGKLLRTPLLRVDTGDPDLDREIVKRGYVRVITGYRRERMVSLSGV